MTKIKQWLPVGLLVACIWYLSSIPNLHLFNDSVLPRSWQVFIQAHALEWGKTGFFSYVISFHPDFLLHKLGHIVVFGLLGVALYYACDEQRRRAVFWAMVFAAGDEWHQAYVPGRSCRLGDIVLDTLAAALCIWAWRQLAKKRIAGS